MAADIKPELSVEEVELFLRDDLGQKMAQVTPMAGGNMSAVFSYICEEKDYIIKFSDNEESYRTESFIAKLLSSQWVPYPAYVTMGKYGELAYAIMERVAGSTLASCDAQQQIQQIPELISILTRINHVNVGSTHGYGWIGPDGNGKFPTWDSYLESSFANQAEGFWMNWHDLFATTCLEKDVFDKCYSRLMAYAPYNAVHRYFVHGDFHQWNIISDGNRISGIIDGNCLYGDFLIDLAILDRHMPTHHIVQAYLDYQEEAGITIPNFKERLMGAYYFKGLDGLRFYAKMGWADAYQETKKFLLELEKN